jgi:uncharacterized protein YndB with AHSA1/START domain
VTAPLAISFDVACPPARAFDVWTTRIATWWPTDHSVTQDPDLTVVLEEGVGGRIYERTVGGDEYDWGVVTVWEPPGKLAYQWHLGRDAADATDVEIRFTALGPADTRVEILHAGWERLGSSADTWRERNEIGWTTLLPHFVVALGAGGA